VATSLQDGQSAAGRAPARDSPLAAQVCGAAQESGDARDLAPAPWLQARALPPPPDATRGCAADRRKKKDLDVLEMPSIPNPFPELCCSPFTSVLSAGLFPKANSRKKQVIKVYSEDETSRALEVLSDITAGDVCQLLVLKNHYIVDHRWTLFEHLPHVEKNYAKYEFFKNPMYFPPEHMVSLATETNGDISPTQILQMFLSSSTYPEIHGFLHSKEQGKKSWEKIYFLLRRSVFPANLAIAIFMCHWQAKQTNKHGAPTNHGFCFKPNKAGGPRDLKMLCAEEEQSRMCWVTSIRLLKYGMQLYRNYMHPYQGRSGYSSQSVSRMRKNQKIIENPTEAFSVAVEEGLAWRKKGCLRLGSHGSPTSSSQSSATNLAIHQSQPWFHHKISREEAQRLIIQQGLVDGVFLVRDSQSNPKTFVLSMSHGQKIKHFQIIPMRYTRFTDLIQLVEFYQLNKGVLSCKLKHYCARIAL
ncbi:hypothetical protein FD754_022792, partial [Muntiacus muntjak]